MEKKLTRNLQHDARSTVKRGSHKAAQVMQFVELSVIFLVVHKNIIIQRSKIIKMYFLCFKIYNVLGQYKIIKKVLFI